MNFIFFLNALRILIIVQKFVPLKFVLPPSTYNLSKDLCFPQTGCLRQNPLKPPLPLSTQLCRSSLSDPHCSSSVGCGLCPSVGFHLQSSHTCVGVPSLTSTTPLLSAVNEYLNWPSSRSCEYPLWPPPPQLSQLWSTLSSPYSSFRQMLMSTVSGL